MFKSFRKIKFIEQKNTIKIELNNLIENVNFDNDYFSFIRVHSKISYGVCLSEK